MQTMTIEGRQGTSTLWVGGQLDQLTRRMPPGRGFVVTDTRVQELYGQRFPDLPVMAIDRGEPIKTLETVAEIYRWLMALEADRSSVLVGIGGGIVCDVAGFAASTYLRGVRFGFVATTLLAQVDASVGGKNGVNFDGFKNMVGVFNQPDFVICDTGLLGTLAPQEVQCGMAEIVKHAAIADRRMFDYLEAHSAQAAGLETQVIQRLVVDSVRIKAAVVNRDEHERGERRKLNFGHTFGHAIEKTTGVPHGQAVSAGMVIAAVLSQRRGSLSREQGRRLVALLRSLKLPVHLPFDVRGALEALRRDKKRQGDGIHFVLLEGLGNAVVETIDLADVQAVAAMAAAGDLPRWAKG